MLLNRCWTPFSVYSWTTVRHGSYYSAMYISVFHVVFTCYCLYAMDGGSSEKFYSPFFEFDQKGAAIASSICILFSLYVLVACVLLVNGVRISNRCMFFPWLIGMMIEILGMACLGIWFLFRYYYNSYSILATFLLYCLDGLHIYCLLCVISQYMVIKEEQEPKLVVMFY